MCVRSRHDYRPFSMCTQGAGRRSRRVTCVGLPVEVEGRCSDDKYFNFLLSHMDHNPEIKISSRGAACVKVHVGLSCTNPSGSLIPSPDQPHV